VSFQRFELAIKEPDWAASKDAIVVEGPLTIIFYRALDEKYALEQFEISIHYIVYAEKVRPTFG
jgi:hypothetical protein